jgi:hypothetical protein
MKLSWCSVFIWSVYPQNDVSRVSGPGCTAGYNMTPPPSRQGICQFVEGWVIYALVNHPSTCAPTYLQFSRSVSNGIISLLSKLQDHSCPKYHPVPIVCIAIRRQASSKLIPKYGSQWPMKNFSCCPRQGICQQGSLFHVLVKLPLSKHHAMHTYSECEGNC